MRHISLLLILLMMCLVLITGCTSSGPESNVNSAEEKIAKQDAQDALKSPDVLVKEIIEDNSITIMWEDDKNTLFAGKIVGKIDKYTRSASVVADEIVEIGRLTLKAVSSNKHLKNSVDYIDITIYNSDMKTMASYKFKTEDISSVDWSTASSSKLEHYSYDYKYNTMFFY